MDEKDLVKRARSGDKNAFAQLYMNYRDRLYRYAYFKLGDESDAQDAVSDCIVEAYSSIGSLRNERAFSAWIFRILYRRCSALIKEQIARKDCEDIDDTDLSSDSTNFRAAELKEALSRLSDEDRDIVLLSTVSGYNSREIGRLLGMNSATVRSRLSRSLKKMREFWGEEI